jgi:predicted Zn-dependent protease
VQLKDLLSHLSPHLFSSALFLAVNANEKREIIKPTRLRVVDVQRGTWMGKKSKMTEGWLAMVWYNTKP